MAVTCAEQVYFASVAAPQPPRKGRVGPQQHQAVRRDACRTASSSRNASQRPSALSVRLRRLSEGADADHLYWRECAPEQRRARLQHVRRRASATPLTVQVAPRWTVRQRKVTLLPSSAQQSSPCVATPPTRALQARLTQSWSTSRWRVPSAMSRCRTAKHARMSGKRPLSSARLSHRYSSSLYRPPPDKRHQQLIERGQNNSPPPWFFHTRPAIRPRLARPGCGAPGAYPWA